MADEIDTETGEIADDVPLATMEPRRWRSSMPPAIAKAIISVNKKVKSLPKDDENKFARFRYTSVDAFYEAIGPLMAEAGIFVFCDEVETQIVRREGMDDQGRSRITNWLVTKYELLVYHESGAGWGPICRQMMVAATGPQAYGVGQSYVEKYFLRGLFKVPTGEGDADAEPKTELPQTRGATRTARPMAPPPLHPTTMPATSAVQPSGTTGTGDGLDTRQAKWISDLLAGESYEIDPKKVGSWATFERILLTAAEQATVCDQIAKLRADNLKHLGEYRDTLSPQDYQRFETILGTHEDRLRLHNGAGELSSEKSAATASENGTGDAPEAIRQFLERESYHLDATKAGSWPRCASWFEKNYLSIASHARDGQFIKLQSDNETNLTEFRKAVKPEVYDNFLKKLAVI